MSQSHYNFNWDIVVCIFGISLLIYLWISSSVYVFIPWSAVTWNEYKVQWIIFYSALNAMILLSFWALLAAAFTNPGNIPPHYKQRAFLSSSDDNDYRWCEECDHPKPPRAHHCSNGCDNCILKMDHHCPWIANCVGYYNHGHFLRYVGYTWLASFTAELALLTRTIQVLWYPESFDSYTYTLLPLSFTETLILFFNTILLMSIVILLGILFVATLRNVFQNCTSIEHMEIDREERSALKEDREFIKFPFNLDWKSNLKLVLGKRVWAWPFPLPSSWQLQGDGTDFETNNNLPADQWPPNYCSCEKCTKIDDDHRPLSEIKSVKSDSELKKRQRRDSEGFVLPGLLPWHSGDL